MKTTLKTFMSLAGASLAAASILTVSAMAAANGISGQSSSMHLTKSGNMWSGKFTTGSVVNFSNDFTEPSSFAFWVKGDSLTMTGKYPYENNYKWTAVTLESDMNTQRNYETGTSKQISNTSSYSGKLYSGSYYGNLYNGTVDGSTVKEKAAVFVALNGYMPVSNIEE